MNSYTYIYFDIYVYDDCLTRQHLVGMCINPTPTTSSSPARGSTAGKRALNIMDSFEEIFEGDRFIEHVCIACGYKGDYFPLPHTFYACPKCLNRRVKALRQIEYQVPDWIIFLEKDSEFRISKQDRIREGHIDFFECAICKKAIMPDNARYFLPPGVHESPPYCIDCVERLRRVK